MYMLRRLLAMIALITGLAAFAAPVYAWGDSGTSHRSEASAHASTRESKEECEDVKSARKYSTAKQSKRSDKRTARVVVVRSVVLGGDRSLE